MTKTILITGANRGLGLALARAYAAAEWRVLATCRKPNEAEALKDLGLDPLELDITQSASITSLAHSLENEPIDLLFNNAGIFGPRSLSLGELTSEDWLEVLSVNTIAPAKLAHATAPNVAKSQARLMVFMSSDMGSVAGSRGGEYAYRSSKAALNMVVATLAQDLKPQGIRTVAMSPGWVQTDMGGGRAPLSSEDSAKGIKKVLDGLPKNASGVFLKYDGSVLDW